MVSLESRHLYSGMIPGFLNGTYDQGRVSIDVAGLTRAVGAEFLEGRAERVDRSESAVVLADGRSLAYDLVSFNLGSGLVGVDLPGVREHALLLKPLTRAVAVKQALSDKLENRPGTVVGGGAAGVEVACTLESLGLGPVRLLEASGQILDGYRPRFRRRALSILTSRGIEVRTGSRVASLESDAVVLESGERLTSEATVWLTGARAPSLFRASGLTTDERGFLSIDDTLRYVADEKIFAVGDCATLLNFPRTPKAGVYAVRQGPVLWHALRAAVAGGQPPTYEPQGDFLSLLNTADGRALMSFRGVVSHGRLAWQLKDRIDGGFMAKYQGLVTAGGGA